MPEKLTVESLVASGTALEVEIESLRFSAGKGKGMESSRPMILCSLPHRKVV
jgi:hypothetical protein